VVVFKFPKEPQQKHQAQNYIKRVQGFPGETIAIYRGELYVTRSLEYPADERDQHGTLLFPRPDDPRDGWRGGDSVAGGPDYRYPHNQKALDLFEKSRKAGFPIGQGGFEQVRKTTDQVLACRRIVWDNDQQPRGLNVKSRWYDPAGTEAKSWVKWSADSAERPRVFTHSGDELDWVRYRHLVWIGNAGSRRHWRWSDLPAMPEPGPVDNFLAYNFGVTDRSFGPDGNQQSAAMSWVGDLILECEAEIGAGAEVVLELSKGTRRYQARFAGGSVTLSSTATGSGPHQFGSRPCSITKPGKYALRFANVDSRLRVWVNDRLIDFGTDADDFHIEAGPEEGTDPQGGWTEANDVAAPAGIGAKGTVTVRQVKLFRDIYYTRTSSEPDVYYVQPDHYLCLGDNSASSSDSRSWGLVPARLMLGKAVFVFFPVGRVGFIK
jgi:signal peptidase I